MKNRTLDHTTVDKQQPEVDEFDDGDTARTKKSGNLSFTQGQHKVSTVSSTFNSMTQTPVKNPSFAQANHKLEKISLKPIPNQHMMTLSNSFAIHHKPEQKSQIPN